MIAAFDLKFIILKKNKKIVFNTYNICWGKWV